jgi:hypothetical protein
MAGQDKASMNDDSEIMAVTAVELLAILLDHAGNSEPVGVIGPPGGGKTELVMQAAEAIGKPFLSPFNLSLSDGVDLNGIPAFSEDRTSVNWVKDKRWIMAAQSPTTVLLDEFSQAQLQAMNPAASIIHEKRIGELYLNPQTWVVWTGNRAQDKCGTNRIPGHIYNRSYLYELHYSAKEHVEYEVQHADTIDMLTLRYLRMKGDEAYKYDPAKQVNPTPRAWSTIMRKLHTKPDTPLATIAGRIGRGFATELLAFRALAPQLPSVEEVLLTPEKARVPEAVSAQFLITDMLADQATVNTFEALVKYGKRLPPEMQAKFVKDSITRHPEVASTKSFVEWGVKFAEVLR